METALPAGRARVPGWIRELPTEFQDANGGVMNDMMSLILRYFGQVRIAAGDDVKATSVHEMLELQGLFSLLIDGDSDLDQRLYIDPEVRKQVVSNLLTVVLVFNTGLRLFAPEYKQTLIEDTSRILEQASAVAHDNLERKPRCAPVNVVEFCDLTKDIIKSRMEIVYALLPTTRHLVQDFGKSERQQSREIGHHECGPFPDSRITRDRERLGRLGLSTVTPTSDFSSISQCAQNRCRSHSDSSKSSEKRSYNSTESPFISPLFSDTQTHHSAYPLTDTVTSESPSEVGSSSITPTSNSTRTSSSCKKCRTTFSDLPTLEAHLCRISPVTRIHLAVRSRVSKSHSGKIDPHQHVTVWHGDGQSISKKRTMILDSAATDNLIRRSTIKKLGHEVTQCATTRRIKGIGGQDVEVSELAQPKWQFEKGSIRHQEINFFVVPEIPGGFDMLLGRVACTYLKINFRVDPGYALVAHADPEEQSTSDQRQQQHGRQHRDGNADMARIRQDIEAKRRELFWQRDVANAANKTKPQAPTSQKNATRLGDNHGR